MHYDAVHGVGDSVEKHERLGADVASVVADAEAHVGASEAFVTTDRGVDGL